MGGMESLTVINKEAVLSIMGKGKWWKIFVIVKCL
jgi:hypothetical protein